MSCDERKECILAAVRKVFAEKGLEGTTTRELAKEAGVSEALLYKHFPSKEALYEEMLGTCDGEFMGEVKKLTSLEPSTSTLVTLLHFMVSALIHHRVPELEVRMRFYLQSLIGNGEFARLIMKRKQDSCSVIPTIADSIKAAVAAKELEDTPVPPHLRALFVDRLAMMIVGDLLPAKPAIDYGVPKEKLIEYVVWFSLRGLGMKDDVIRRYYNPKALALLAA